MTQARSPDVDVLVVGAGPVGLALANELGLHSVRCLVVEQRRKVGNSPRAKLTNVRTAELLRRWGLADELRQASSMPRQQPSNVIFTTSLTGHVLARFENAFYRLEQRSELFSEPAQWVPQYTLEEVLERGALRRSSVELRFDTRLDALQTADDGVVATLSDVRTGARQEISARYLIGADGGRSTVREQLGIPMQGIGAVAANLNVLFRAPALQAIYQRMPAIQYWTVNPQACALMGPVDDQGLWYLIAARLGEDVADGDAEQARRLIRGACGMDLDIEIVGIDPWYAHCLQAEHYGSDRVFLAGDACHMHPPFGGHGMNMGIGDAVDLGWKLAAMIHGWGGPALPDSYEQERRPVHRQVMDESNANYQLAGTGLLRDDLDVEGPTGAAAREALGQQILREKRREFFNLGLVLGYRYGSSPIVAADTDTTPATGLSLDYVPAPRPGALAPHFWLRDGRSLFDAFGTGFTLLVDGSLSGDDGDRLARLADSAGIPLEVIRLDEARFAQLYRARLALVRPDQHLAWLGDRLPDDAGALLARVVGGPPVRSNDARRRVSPPPVHPAASARHGAA
ncbi:MAG: FAD-dependent monooxygenase [Burkholderiaceae bacterium]